MLGLANVQNDVLSTSTSSQVPSLTNYLRELHLGPSQIKKERHFLCLRDTEL